MAVVQNPIVGRSKQKFANAIFSTWKGINTLRSKPLSVANPKSTRQVAQRVQFTNVSRVARQILPVLQIGFKGLAIGKSQYNVFVSENIKFFSSTIDGEVEGQADIKISKGNLPKSTLIIADKQLGNDIAIAWTNPAGSNGTDTLCYAVIRQDSLTYQEITTTTRASSSYIISSTGFDPIEAGKTCYVYIFFKNQNGEVSDSTNIIVTP